MISRFLDLTPIIKKGKVLIIYGARRVGKTTLLKNFLQSVPGKYKFVTGDDIITQQVLSSQNLNEILAFFNGYEIAAIDEAQQIKNIGIGLKLLVDNNPGISVVVTGSSSFNIEQETGEPLTGRKRTITLFPFAQEELMSIYNKFELNSRLEDFLIYGAYPDVILASSHEEKIEIIQELVNSYLLKDVFSLASVKGSKVFIDLLKLLAFQAGNEVSINELAGQLGLDAKTAARYIDLLEKTFVIKRLTPFSKNLRKEISKKNKFYFVDNGIRNGVIAQFNRSNQRDDTGCLFENFMMMERMKYISNKSLYRNLYFWRTYDGQEIDLIEEYDGKLFPYEFKWNENSKYKLSSLWKENYKSEPLQIIHKKNYLDYLTE